MDVEKKYKICKYFIVICLTGAAFYYVFNTIKPFDKTPIIKSEQLQTANQIKQAADNADISLSDEQSKIIQEKIQNAKPAGSVLATAGTVQQVAEQQRQQNGSDFASVVSDSDISKLPDDTPIELNQYHIYAAPRVLHEIGLKTDIGGKEVNGISFGIKRRINTEGKYIGMRADYDWNNKKTAIWLTYTY